MESWNDVFNGQFRAKKESWEYEEWEKDIRSILTQINSIAYRLDKISGNLDKIAETLGEMHYE
jgi:hypothetical protein